MTNDDLLSCYQHNLGEDYANSLPTVGDAIAQVLKFFGCHTVFGVGGDFAANIIAALDGQVEVVPSSNETHAGYSACAQAEITGIGATLTTYTVGSLPCTSAAALALAEKLPVVFISGAPGEKEIAGSTLHHMVASGRSWHANPNCALDSFRALGMKAERLQGERAKGQPNMAAERFFQLLTHAFLNKEPVFIEIPRDLLSQKTQSLQLPQSPQQLSTEHFVLQGASHIAAHILTKLRQAKCPLLFLGENMRLNYTLRRQINEFCQQHQIPYATSWLAKGTFDESAPLSIGCYNGVFSAAHIRRFIENDVDYIFEVDTSIQKLDTNNAFGSNTHYIDNFHNKTVIKGTVQNQQGLIHIFARLLSAELPSYDIDLPAKPEVPIEDQAKLDFHNLADVLNTIQSNIEPSLIYLPEVGNSYFASYGLLTKQSSLGRSWLTNPWYGAMGTSLPYARTIAKLLQKHHSNDIPVVITGDGGFHFQLNELIHFQKEQLAVVILYMRNDIYHLGKSGDGAIYHCSTPEFDVLKLVQAYGGKGVRCETVAQFKSQFLDAIAEKSGITLIEVPADTDPRYQSDEIRMLNLYIRCQNGDKDAQQQWQQAINMGR